jgi:protein-tyrosine phosphatase
MASARRRALARRRGLASRGLGPLALRLGRAGRLPAVRAPTWIEEGRLLAGRHPCAWSPHDAEAEVRALLELGVTLVLDLTQPDELAPYDGLLPAGARHVRVPVQDFTTPSEEQIVAALDLIDDELEGGGVVYVHCWAGCGRTGVVVGCWLVRHGADPSAALRRIAELRGLGCPQTLEQRLTVLAWAPGR